MIFYFVSMPKKVDFNNVLIFDLFLKENIKYRTKVVILISYL